MALPYYISEMVKSMRQDSIALEAELEMQGHPNLFKSTSVVTSKEWARDLLPVQVSESTGSHAPVVGRYGQR